MAPILAIGRMPSETPAEVRQYLDKVRAHEKPLAESSLDERLWRKQVLHLGGGGSPTEQNDIRNKLANMEQVLESSDFGANVFSFFKTFLSSFPSTRDQTFSIDGKSLVAAFSAAVFI